MPGNEVQLIIKTIDETRKGTKSAIDNLNSLAKTALLTGVSFMGMNITVKKAFEWAEQGAVITQTRESFDLFLEKVGVAPDLLDDLRSASRGTIKDIDLMSATMTLAAGAEEELAQALVSATPQLMEIAKAANKLNPALGDTNFMYQSLATGIKRASPLILDNLGLTIKVGEANEKYAEKLGKTSKELTATEQKMALLNAAIEAGGTLIEQAGGTTESAADTYAQFKVTIGEITDAFKVAIAEGITPAVESLNDWIKTVQEAQKASKQETDERWNSIEALEEWSESLEGIPERYRGIAKEEIDARINVLKFKQTQQDLHDVNKLVRDSLGEVEGGLEAVGEQAGLTAEEIEELAESQIKELNYLIGVELGQSIEDHEEKLRDLQAEYDEAKSALDEFIAKYGDIERVPSWKTDDLEDLQGALKDSEKALEEEKKAWQRNTQEILFNMAARALEALPIDVQAEALGALAEQMGLIDEPTREAWENMGELTQLLAADKITVDEFATAVGTLDTKLTDLPEEVTPEVALEITGLEDLERAYYILRQLGVDIPITLPETQRRQQGGTWTVQGPPGVDRVPVSFFATAGEQVTVTPQGQYGPSSSSMSIGEIHVHVGEGADGHAIAQEISYELGRMAEQARMSGTGYVGI